MTNSYQWLLQRLDAFIRKFYANQLLRGVLTLLIGVVGYILLASVSEYFLYLPVWVKLAVVGLFIGLGSLALIFWIAIPLLHMASMGKILSREQAAAIVGTHFPEIGDKLLNILQLKAGADDDQVSRSLVEASIEQKSKQLSVVPITRAVDLSKNKRLLPYLLPLLLIGVFILVAAPNVFRDASERLLQPTKAFEKPAPFQFLLVNKDLQALRNTDFTLVAAVAGSALPAELFIEIKGERIPMASIAAHKYQYIFRNVTEPVTFQFFAAGFYSKKYTLTIAQKPLLKAMKVALDYPDYTGRKDETRNSLGDLIMPAGTRVSWELNADYTDAAMLHWASGSSVNLPKSGNQFAWQYRFLRDTAYTISIHNNTTRSADSFRYRVQVIPDEYPVVQMQEFRDTVVGRQVVLQGTTGDDYGIARLLVHFNISDDKGRLINAKSLPLKNTGGNLVTFQHYFDIDAFKLQSGQKLTYFVEAWDNDAVNGSKASRSEVMSYQQFTPAQRDSAIDQNAKQINAGLSSSASQIKKLQQDLKEAQDKLLQSSGSNDWQQQQTIQELAEKQDQLKQLMENTKKRFEEQLQQSKDKKYSDDLKEKQQNLKDQMDNLMNKELKDQMKKLQELMQKLNKEQAFEKMEQLEQQNKLFNMDLERMQALMKKMEMQMRMEDLANKIEDLASKQLDLKKKTDNNEKTTEALSKEQKDLKKELDALLKEDLKSIKELNKESKPQEQQDLEEPEKDGKDAGEDMQESGDQLDQQKKSNSSKSQKDAAQKLQKMASMMKKKAAGMDAEQIDLDIKATRQILTNLMRLSFEQEKLMEDVKVTSTSSQTYIANQSDQGKLYSASRTIRDSLFSLSKRVSQLATTINKETSDLEGNMKQSVRALENRYVSEAITRQQYVMTSTNNLALMLNEVLSNLLQMQSKAQQGEGKPGEGAPSPGKGKKPGPGQQLGDVITQQKKLGSAMDQMKQAAERGKKGKDGKEGEGEQGQNPGGKKGDGKSGSQGQGGENGQGQGGSGSGEDGEPGESEKLARLASQQAALRRQIQQIQSLLNSKGMNGASRQLTEIQKEMDRNETDLVNRKLTSEFAQRQRDIMTRLLETEKAVREQEEDDKRASNAGIDVPRPVPGELQKYLEQQKKMLELYRTVPPQLKPYYRGMVERYFNNIGTK